MRNIGDLLGSQPMLLIGLFPAPDSVSLHSHTVGKLLIRPALLLLPLGNIEMKVGAAPDPRCDHAENATDFAIPMSATKSGA
jgi:hypothetical protein